jgi:hypothetical protein
MRLRNPLRLVQALKLAAFGQEKLAVRGVPTWPTGGETIALLNTIDADATLHVL